MVNIVQHCINSISVGSKTEIFVDCLETEMGIFLCNYSNKLHISLQYILLQCLWKLTKQIPHILPLINLDKLLLEIHLFMQSYLDAWPSPSHNDMPFRTVKTILYHITNSEGIKVQCNVCIDLAGWRGMQCVFRLGKIEGRGVYVSLWDGRGFDR